MILHSSGRCYIHVFPRSPFYGEIKECYKSAAERIPWISVEDYEDWTPLNDGWNDPQAIAIFWGLMPMEIPPDRKASYVFRFTESVGDPELLASSQEESMRAFAWRSSEPDLVLCGNPVVADYWSRLCRKVGVAPVGYEPSVLGEPDWECPKQFDVCFRGTNVGRRTWLLSEVQAGLQNRFLWIQDFGEERKRKMDQCLADLYLGHSEDYSFPGMRLWQGISSSAALITERSDAWPAKPGRHYIALEPAVQANTKRFLRELNYILAYFPLETIARTAHEELAFYTVDRCMEMIVSETKGLSR